jgi:hypothetical protein
MSVRRSSIVLSTVGIVLIALSLLVVFVVVPFATRLPGSTDLTVHYSGTASLLNSAALQSGDISHSIESNVPTTVDRQVKVLSTHGTTAILKDSLNIHAGSQNIVDAHTYALNRTSLKGVKSSNGTAVEPSTGALSSAFPIGPKPNNSYRYYDPTTRTIVPIAYTGRARTGGRSVNVYKIAASGPVKDAAVLKLLPPALPKSLLPALAGILPASVRAQFTPAVVGGLPDPVPVTYTGTTHIVADVDRQTGVAIDEAISEQIVVNVMVGARPVSLLPVLALDFHITPASIHYLADKASSAGRLLTILTIVVPIGLGVIGVILIVVAVIRRKKPQPSSPGPQGPPARRREGLVSASAPTASTT